MLILVSGSTRTVSQHHDVGVLCVPRAGVSKLVHERPWAADNDAFKAFDEARYLVMLDRLHVKTQWRRCLFVTAPDVVGSATKTLALFRVWAPALRRLGCPVALVLQDGMDVRGVPWSTVDAVFVGGSTQWKLSRCAAELVAYARARGKWAHMGRVNSEERVAIAKAMGCQSIDGTSFSRFGDVYVPRGLSWGKQPRRAWTPSVLW